MTWLFSKALMQDFENSRSLPGQAGEFLGESCSDGEPSALLSGESTPLAYCAPDKMKGFSRLSRFGVTFKPLTESLGADVLMSYLAAFPVRTYLLQEKAQESTENDLACGATWLGSLGKYDPASRSWKTAQRSFLGDLEESLVTCPRSGMTAGGECWELPMLERRTSVTDSGWWPTPIAQDAKHSGYAKSGPGMADKLSYAVVRWPTPTAHNAKETNAPSEAERNTPTLAAQVGGKLNPTWVEWLMGWPLGWTDLKPSVTAKCLYAQQQLGECLEAVE